MKEKSRFSPSRFRVFTLCIFRVTNRFMNYENNIFVLNAISEGCYSKIIRHLHSRSYFKKIIYISSIMSRHFRRPDDKVVEI